MINKFTKLILSALVACGVFSTTCMAGERLTSDELQTLLVGNTVTGVYPDEGASVTFAEYYKDGGKLKGKDSKYGRYSGHYKFKTDGCFHIDYDGSDDWDGCY